MSEVMGFYETTLEEDETIIERGLTMFIAVGDALLRIRDGKKYRGRGHATFEEYCEERWGFKRAHAYRLMDAAGVAHQLSPIGDMPLPANEGQARELARLPDAATRRNVWRMVIEEHGPHVTAAKVQAAVEQYFWFKDLDAVIERGMPDILAAGKALAQVHADGRYQETHATFEDFCRDHLHLAPAMVRAMMDEEVA